MSRRRCQRGLATLIGGLALWGADASAQELEEYLEQSHEVDKVGMSILTAWGAVNTIVGVVGWAATPDDTEWRAFHQMNLAWGAVNTGLAINGLVGALRYDDDPTSVDDAFDRSLGKQRFYVTMVGLDVLYVTTGALLWALGGDTLDGRWRGYGRSLVLQGATLMVFDAAMALSHSGASKGLWATPVVGPTMELRIGGRF